MTIRFGLVILIVANAAAQFDQSECGQSKGCWIPDDSLCFGGCSGMGVSYRVIDETHIEFELFFKSAIDRGIYVAVGFSDDYYMGNESVIECSSLGKQPVSMKFSYNGYYDSPEDNTNSRIERDYTSSFAGTSISYNDGLVYCKSIVDVSDKNDPHVFHYVPSQQYYLLLVNGKTSDTVLTHHDHDSTSPATYLRDLNMGFNSLHCGHEKGCAIPDNCNGLGTSYKVLSDDLIEFEIFGNIDGVDRIYAAVGFSDDDKMGDESVIECSKMDGEPLSMKFSYNLPGSENSTPRNVRIDGEKDIRTKYMSNQKAFVQEGKLYCSATVNVSGSSISKQVFKYNPNEAYFLLLASGKTNGTSLMKHTNNCVDPTRSVFLDQPQPQFNAAECGVAKGCFVPDDCPEGCDAMIVGYRLVNDSVFFVELTARQPKKDRYVAVGFSTTGTMGNASVLDCSSFAGGDYNLYYSYNIVTDDTRDNQRAIANSSSYISNSVIVNVDGNLYCSAYFNVAGHPQDPKVFKYDPQQEYFLLLAEGPTDATAGVQKLLYHTMKSISSARFLADVNPTDPPPPPDNGSFNGTDCGKLKACFQPPDKQFGVAYRLFANGELMDLELMLTSSTAQGVWVAVGFSLNGKMASSNAIECSALQGQPLSMKFSYNDDSPKNVRIDGEPDVRRMYIQNFVSSYANGQIYCRATVNVSGSSNDRIFKYNPTNSYNLLLATGPTAATVLTVHTDTIVSSSRRLDDVTAGNGTSGLSNLVIAHAVLMIIAWFFCVPTAVLFARVLRNSWPTRKPMGLLIWFHVHRTANLFAILLMVIAFILILCELNWKWAKPSSSWGGKHAIIGLTALILGWLQPFISTLRCTPDNPRRPLFNYVHRGVGVIAIILATTAVGIAAMHFTAKNHTVQLVLALMPITVLLGISVFFELFKFIVDDVSVTNLKKLDRFRQLIVYGCLAVFAGTVIALAVLIATA